MFKTLQANLFPLTIICGLLVLVVKTMMPYHPALETQQEVQKSLKHSTDMVNAMKLCGAFLAEGTATKCIVDPYAINVWINTTKEEAAKICQGSATLAAQYASFEDRWRIIVFSPASRKHPLATCPLSDRSIDSADSKQGDAEDHSDPYMAWFFFLVCAFLYLLPWVIAEKRHHRNVVAILWLNLLAGWTAIGWLIAFIWSLTADTKQEKEPADHSKEAEPKASARATNDPFALD